MPHADHATLPSDVQTKADLYSHALTQLAALLDDRPHWISALANTSSLLYHLLNDRNASRSLAPVNWVGFYLSEGLLGVKERRDRLLLGPFNGKPACQYVKLDGRRGVCAEAYRSDEPKLVPDVHAHEGHIACDARTNSEIVVPLSRRGERHGVLDLDSEEKNGFDDDDRQGLQGIIALLFEKVDWPDY